MLRAGCCRPGIQARSRCGRAYEERDPGIKRQAPFRVLLFRRRSQSDNARTMSEGDSCLGGQIARRAFG
jgi:hypothetical protein